jgi:hypothetical protein
MGASRSRTTASWSALTGPFASTIPTLQLRPGDGRGPLHFESSALATAYYSLKTLALLHMHTPDPIGFFTHHPDKTTYQKMLNGAYNRGEWWDGMKAAFDGCKTTDVLGCFARSSNGAIAVDHAAAIVGLHAGAGRGHPVRCAGVGDRPRSLLGQPTRSHRCRPSTRSPPAPASCSCPCIPPAPDRARAAGLSGRSRSRRAGLAGPARRP